MGFLQDMAMEIENYLAEHVRVEFVDWTLPSNTKTFNVGDIASFNLLVTNNGYLQLVDVRITIWGSDYAEVSANLGIQFLDSVISWAPEILPHSSTTLNEVQVRAKASTSIEKMPQTTTTSPPIINAGVTAYYVEIPRLLVRPPYIGWADQAVPQLLVTDGPKTALRVEILPQEGTKE